MNAERVGSLFWLLFGLAVMGGSAALGLGDLRAPGSGFLGFLAGCFITLMAAIVLAQSFTGSAAPVPLTTLWTGLQWRRPVVIALLILCYILGLERLGFVFTSLLFMLITFKWVERFPWPKVLLVSGLAVGFAFALFHTFLKTPLPRGPWGF